ncbi:hypothetical protein HQ584_01215 [Patescibacteria group bacterium]|nr:hypothetical protein [Patescibacteria group bacterium]
MKKGLIGLLIVSFVLMFAASALATPDVKIAWLAHVGIEFDSDTRYGETIPYFHRASTYLNVRVSGALGPWNTVAIGSCMYDEATDHTRYGDPYAIKVKAFMEYTGEDFKLTLDPTGMAPDTLISEVQTGVFKTQVPKISARPGIMLEIPIGALKPYVIVNSAPGVKKVNSVYNYVVAALFKSGNFSIDTRYGIGNEEDQLSYGTSIGTYAKYKKSPVELKVHYAVFDPKPESGAGSEALGYCGTYKNGVSYYLRFKYALPPGMILNAFYFEYYAADAALGAWLGKGGVEDYSCLKWKGYMPLGKGVVLGLYAYSYDYWGDPRSRYKGKLTMDIK